jgi:anti-sigma regulatory factor (Ser/Thr protein kinase)
MGSNRAVELQRVRHAVRFYRGDGDLTQTVVRFLGSGLEQGGTALVIATPTHRRRFTLALADRGVDPQRARREGTLRELDAAETLARFMVRRRPDAIAFDEAVGGMVREIRAEGRRPVAFGEMVALLWEAGNVVGALELEELWNRLLHDEHFSLVCAYPASIVGDGIDEVCELHSEVLGETRSQARQARTILPPAPRSVGAARRFVAETLEGWGYAMHGHDVVLAVSELASNAVRHAHTRFAVSVTSCDGTVRVGVEDRNPELPMPRAPGPEISNGRGLLLVEALTRRWGAEPLGDAGKVVWVEFPVSSVPAAPRPTRPGRSLLGHLSG